MVRKTRPTGRMAIALAASLSVMAIAGAALAEARAEQAPAMPLGAAAPAPDGFIDLCRRAPDQCPAVGPAADLERLAAEANRRRWTALFGLAPSPSGAPSAAPTSTVMLADGPIVPLLPRLVDIAPRAVEAARADVDQAGAVAAEDAAIGALELAGTPLAAQTVAATDFASVAVAAPSPADTAPLGPDASIDAAIFRLDRDGWRAINRIRLRTH